ncbi:hypothetical protein [Helicobacter pylori]|uniref:hypothetical protein n=1 Tax=Helicobacter pylori TaxID=210 RepID=UPI001E28EF93|nr:hypothetical protein [Helicobacter pylori]
MAHILVSGVTSGFGPEIAKAFLQKTMWFLAQGGEKRICKNCNSLIPSISSLCVLILKTSLKLSGW